MKKDTMNDVLYQNIIKSYLDTNSVQKTAEKNEVSAVKVRKVLITEELWSSKTSDDINHYVAMGKSTEEIARILCTTEKAVQQYLPYTRGLYMGDKRSVAALNSEDYRKRIETIKERVLKKRAESDNSYSNSITMEDDGLSKKGSQENRVSILEWQKMDNPLFEQYPGIIFGRELPREKEQDMLKKLKMEGEDIYRLHLDFVPDWLPEGEWGRYEGSESEYTDILKKYGGVKYGNTISRDIIIPGGTRLFSLNYIIQRLFGWQNSHLHRFQLSDEQMKALCDDKLERFANLIGVVFRSPWMNEEDEFWADDYENGSFKNWLRKKYTGSPVSFCYGEGFFECRKDVFKYYDRTVNHIIEQYCNEAKKDQSYVREEIFEHYKKIADIAETKGKNAAIAALNANDVRRMGDGYTGNLLERLSIEEVLCFGDRRLLGDKVGEDGKIYDRISFEEKIPASFDEFMNEEMLDEVEEVKLGDDSPYNQPMTNPFTDEIFYNYDFGDNWTVRIKGSCGCEDLIEAGRITQDEIDDAIVQVYTTYRPVVIAQDGLSVFDDVGGMTGYCEFLKGTYGKGEYDGPYEYGDKKENLEWAKSLGWTGKMCNNRTML